MFDSLKETLDAHTDVHAQILENVKATNGKIADIQRWRERVVGAMWAGGILCTVVVLPLVTWAILEVNTLDEQINKSVSQAFEDYLELNGYVTE
jgi:hypothetical protein